MHEGWAGELFELGEGWAMVVGDVRDMQRRRWGEGYAASMAIECGACCALEVGHGAEPATCLGGRVLEGHICARQPATLAVVGV